MNRFILAAMLAATASASNAATPVLGKWMTAERDSIVEIAPCGATLCGRVLRILKPRADNPQSLDRNNPDPALRNRSIQGINILSGFVDNGSSWKGQIYDPKSGKTYKSYLTRNPDGTLKVQGCVAFLCQTFQWTAAR